MHQALYRKYRPQTFSDVCGQEHISKTLKSQISTNRFTHAYLFTGSRGTGKTSSAKILAKAVNCLNPIDGDPCNECENCKGIDSGEILDVVEIDAASNNGVDDIRTLREQVEYMPSKAKFRVYIIDEVHMLSKSAFNALLKTLEEPPEHVVFILATTEVWAIPPTILSRCQRYDFNRISVDIIANRLKYVCMQENVSISDDAAVLIAKLADGGMRDALSLLDLCAGNTNDVTEEVVSKNAGLIGKEHLFKFVEIFDKKDASAALKLLDELYNNSCDIERLFIELVSHYRDLLVAKTSKDYARLITGTNEDIVRTYEQSKQIRFENILYVSEKLTTASEKMKSGASKRIVAETTFISLCTDDLDGSSSALLKRIGELEKKILSGNFVANESQAVEEIPVENLSASEFVEVKEEVKPQPIEEKPVDKKSTAVEKFTKWAEVLEILKTESSIIYAVLNGSKAYVDGGFLLIDAPNPAFLETIRSAEKYKNAIRDAALKVSGVKYKLGPYNKKTAAKVVADDPLDELSSLLGNDLVEGI